MINKISRSLRGSLSLLLVLVTFNTLLAQGAKQAEAQQQAIAFINVNVVPFDRERVMVRGRWLPESELRKMLENVAALNQQNAEGSTAKGNFSGTWTLDKANSEGLPPDMDQLMTVVQTGDKLSIETKLMTPQGEQVVPDSYVLDGKEADFTPRTPGGQSGKGKRISKLAADGNSIEVSEKATFETPEGVVNIDATRKWTLSPDGKTLRIEMTIDGPNGKQSHKRTFIRK